MNITPPGHPDSEMGATARSHATTARNVLLCGLVLAVAMLSFFVHLLEQQLARGETVRATWRTPVRSVDRPVGSLVEHRLESVDRSTTRMASR